MSITGNHGDYGIHNTNYQSNLNNTSYWSEAGSFMTYKNSNNSVN